VRIKAMVKQRWGLKESLWSNNRESKKKNRDNKERSKNGPRESQKEVEEGTLLSISY